MICSCFSKSVCSMSPPSLISSFPSAFQIQFIYMSCQPYLQTILHLSSLSISAVTTLVQATIISCLSYWNNILTGLHVPTLTFLQSTFYIPEFLNQCLKTIIRSNFLLLKTYTGFPLYSNANALLLFLCLCWSAYISDHISFLFTSCSLCSIHTRLLCFEHKKLFCFRAFALDVAVDLHLAGSTASVNSNATLPTEAFSYHLT